YIYFAGDSFTWGFARYENKFATRFEDMTGIPTAKCGVYGTGARHQFDKFLAVTRAIGHLPKSVVVGFHDNDVQDDYAFPTMTAIDGWGVPTVYVEEPNTLRLFRPDIHLIAQEVTHTRSEWELSKEIIKRYSLTTNVALLAKHRFSQPGKNIAPPPKFGFHW